MNSQPLLMFPDLKRIIFGTGILLLVAIPCTAHAQDTDGTSGSSVYVWPDTTVAIRVESETYPMKIFKKRVQALLKKARNKAKKKQSKQFNENEARTRIQNHLKKRLISRMILDVYADRSEVTITEERILKQLRKRFKLKGGKDAYLERIKKRGQSLGQIKQQIRDRLKRREFVMNEIGPVEVTDTEVRRIYEKRKHKITKISKKRAYRIFRKKIRKKKENLKSRRFIARLKKKSRIRTNF